MYLPVVSSELERSGRLIEPVLSNLTLSDINVLEKIPIALNLLLWMATGALALSSLLGFLSRLNWLFELFSHFRIQYAAGSGICALLFLITNHWTGFSLALAALLLNLILIAPIYQRRKCPGKGGATWRLLLAKI
jgi:hypothetical protein